MNAVRRGTRTVGQRRADVRDWARPARNHVPTRSKPVRAWPWWQVPPEHETVWLVVMVVFAVMVFVGAILRGIA